MARENGQQGTSNLDLASVHLEQLPAYEAAPEIARDAEGPVIHSPIPVRRGSVAPTTSMLGTISQVSPPAPPAPPNEPPPGYEEAQEGGTRQ